VATEGVAGGGEGTAGFNDRIARGVAEGSSGAEGRGCACAWSRASRSHSRSSTTVPHDPRSGPTTASVYRPHPHSQQPLSIPRKVAPSYARPPRAFGSRRKSLGVRGPRTDLICGQPQGLTRCRSTCLLAFPLGDTRVASSVEEDETRRSHPAATCLPKTIRFLDSACLRRRSFPRVNRQRFGSADSVISSFGFAHGHVAPRDRICLRANRVLAISGDSEIMF
jgi:hypothetical protein